MPKQIADSLHELSQFLALEVQKHELDKRRDLVNKTGSDIATMFKSLPENATIGQVQSTALEAYALGGERGVINEVSPLANMMLGVSTQKAQQANITRENNLYKDFLNENSPDVNLSNVPAKFSAQALQTVRSAYKQIELPATSDKQAQIITYNPYSKSGKFEPIGEPITFGPTASEQAQANFENFKKEALFKNNLELNRQKALQQQRFSYNSSLEAIKSSNKKSETKVNEYSTIQKNNYTKAKGLAISLLRGLGYEENPSGGYTNPVELLDSEMSKPIEFSKKLEDAGWIDGNIGRRVARFKDIKFKDENGTIWPGTIISDIRRTDFEDFINAKESSDRALEMMTEEKLTSGKNVDMGIDPEVWKATKIKWDTEITKYQNNPNSNPQMLDLINGVIAKATGKSNANWQDLTPKEKEIVMISLYRAKKAQ